MNKKGTVGQVFEVARCVRGGKKSKPEPVGIINPQNGQLVVNRKEIRKVSLKYCKDTLKNNPPSEGFEMGAKVKDDLHTQRMKLTKGDFGVKKKTLTK